MECSVSKMCLKTHWKLMTIIQQRFSFALINSDLYSKYLKEHWNQGSSSFHCDSPYQILMNISTSLQKNPYVPHTWETNCFVQWIKFHMKTVQFSFLCFNGVFCKLKFKVILTQSWSQLDFLAFIIFLCASLTKGQIVDEKVKLRALELKAIEHYISKGRASDWECLEQSNFLLIHCEISANSIAL